MSISAGLGGGGLLSGLVLVANKTATSGTSISFDNCFTSAFENYRVVISNLRIAAASGYGMRLRSNGTDLTSGYYAVRADWTYTTGDSVERINNGGNWNIPVIADGDAAGGVIDLYSPFLAVRTSYSGAGSDSRTTGYGLNIGGGIVSSTSAYDGFTLFSAQTISNINVRVYGYRNQ